MKLRRKSPLPTARQRLRSDPQPDVKLKKTFSYSSRRSDAALNTGRQLQRDIKESASKGLRYSLQRFGMIILLIALSLSLLNIVKLNSDAKVEVLSDKKSLVRPTSDYQKFAAQQLAGSAWNNNKITINTSELDEKMLKEFPELTSVSVTVPLLAHRPIVYVEPSQASLVLLATNGAFIVSESGRALVRGTDVGSLNQPDLPVITDQSGLRLELGRQALPASSVDFISTVLAQLSAAKVSVGAILLPSGANELDIQIAGQPYSVKFNLQSSKAREQVGTYLATIASLQKQSVTPSKYIDVRVNGRAYYQ